MAGGIGMKVFCTVCIVIVSCASCTTFESKYNGVHSHFFISTHNITWTQQLQRAVERSKQRLQSFNAKTKATDLEVAVNRGNGEFVMKLAIGTPGVAMAGIVDTASDLTWTQCKPCSDCFAQSTPIFDPSLSSSYEKNYPVLTPSAPPKLFPNSPASLSAASTPTHTAISPSPWESSPLKPSLFLCPNQKPSLHKHAFCLGAAMTMKEEDLTKQAELWGWDEGPCP